MAILVFGVGQLVLPSIAASVVRGRVDRYGKVQSVKVSAFPAIELAFGDADTVTVHMADYHAPESSMARNLSQAAGVSNLNVHIGMVTSGLLTATNVTLTKRGSALRATGSVSEAAIRSAVPEIVSVKPISSADGELTLQATAELFLEATGDFTIAPSNGGIVAAGTGLLSALQFTLWSDPRVRVTSIAGQATPTGMTVTATARMR